MHRHICGEFCILGTTAAFALRDSGGSFDLAHATGNAVKLPSILPKLFLQKSLKQSGNDCRTGELGTAAHALDFAATQADRRRSENILFLRLPVTEAPSFRLTEELLQTPETIRQSRRLAVLQDQLQVANRRASGPFSHPFATRGSLTKLRDQIRDVSRVADAVMLNAEAAGVHRVNELCADLRCLLQTQQRWTDRLENQIWRLESQASLMRRLQRLLLDRSPGNDLLWELCEVIARETQALPSGLFLLPEPGHRVLLAPDHLSSRVSWSVEQARLAVFSGVTLLPEVRGADIVAQALHAASAELLEFAGRDREMSVFAEPLWMRRAAIAGAPEDVVRLIKLAGTVLTATDTLSQTAVDRVAPPAIEEFYGGLSVAIAADSIPAQDLELAQAICEALGLPFTSPLPRVVGRQSIDDAAIVLTHKLRWHNGTTDEFAEPLQSTRARMKRPHFAASNSPAGSLVLFAREEK